MIRVAKGSFKVTRNPIPADDVSQKVGCMRMHFEKQFQGPLEATGTVSMMGIMDQKTGSGGYVALERVTGVLDGRKGSFCLQHSCTMAQGVPTQSIVVIPDSGVDGLVGLKGAMVIDLVGDEHFYTLEYEF